jgi:hypothetical protein
VNLTPPVQLTNPDAGTEVEEPADAPTIDARAGVDAGRDLGSDGARPADDRGAPDAPPAADAPAIRDALPPPPDLAPPPPDAAPPPPDGPPALVVDDFEDATLTRNNLGGDVTWDNQSCALVSGEIRCAWTGRGGYQDFIEALRNNWCEYDLGGYSKLRLRMRASAPGKRVQVAFYRSSASCNTGSSEVVLSVVLTTAMTTYDADISGVSRGQVSFIEIDPQTLDDTAYFFDDIQLVR